MNKQLTNQSSTLSKNMTARENLSLDNLTTTTIILPIYLYPSTPPNPVKGMIYIMHNPTDLNLPYNIMIYDNNQWN